jgi:probable LLM family oxidoreductase
MDTLQLGLDTFGDVTHDPNGVPLPYADVIRHVVAEAVLADQVGVDAITLGEHHRDDFAISSPETVLAGIATQTSRIILSSGVTVLSSDDPIRVFQRFATLDALSSGRAEVIVGRGSFTESFPLFGFELGDYQVLFEEKLNLFVELLKESPVTWSGTIRPALNDQEVYPKSHSGSIRTWVGVGGSPESVVRAANYGLPLMLAIIGGAPDRFAPYVDLYHRALEQLGKEPQPIGVHSPGHIARTDEQAIEEMWPHYEAMFGRIGRERGWAPVTKEHYLNEVHHGALFVGCAETVATKIARTVAALGINRFDLKYSTGPMSHQVLMQSIETYGTTVIPMVRDMLASGTPLASTLTST